MKMNQAVLFTKPVHHLDFELTPEKLRCRAESYFKDRGFQLIEHRTVTGTELEKRDILRCHYLMYSRGSYGNVHITDEGRTCFKATFGMGWDEEVEAGRIMGNPQLLKYKQISTEKLFAYWNDLFNAGSTHKIQDGLNVGWIDELKCYCINAFYPMVENLFYHPNNIMHYYVVDFDPVHISWANFRKQALGKTDCSIASLGSFRGQLFADYPVKFPGRDNFVHGSAGPFEAFIERAIHEPNFDLKTNPIGFYLQQRGVTIETFNRWKSAQCIFELGELFRHTEEINTADALPVLDSIPF